jgi:probable rRNA maturation factor
MKPKAKVEIVNLQSTHSVNRALLRRVLLQTMKEAEASGTLSLAVVDEEEMTELNRRFLGREEPTDVLSFPMQDEDESDMFGEIVICADVAAREAEARKTPYDAELALYAIHGLLHLLGYNDGTPAQRKRMREREREILTRFGLSPE